MKRRKAERRAEVENEKEGNKKERRYLPAEVSILTSDQKTDKRESFKRSIVKKTLFWLPEAKVACWGDVWPKTKPTSTQDTDHIEIKR